MVSNRLREVVKGTVRTRKVAFSLAAVCLMLFSASQAMAALPTSTTLQVTSAGAGVSTVTSGSVVTLVATVSSSGAPVWPGRVNFCDATAAHCTDIHILGTAQLNNAGSAVLSFVPGIGTHSYQAVFVGSNSAGSSASSPTPLAVTGLFPTMTSISQGGTGFYNLTATTTGLLGPGALFLAPTSIVSFVDASNSNSVLATASLGAGTPGLSFANSANLLTGKLPSGVVSADFNGDGKLDLATVNYGDNTVTISLGRGDGTFTTLPASPSTGNGPQYLATADFNGDGVADLAAVNFGDGTVTILLGNGNGTFSVPPAQTQIPVTGSGPVAAGVGDFNNDGNQDLAIANTSSNTVTILLGNGDGTFATSSASPSTGNGPVSIAVADFNGDGKLDIGAANSVDNTVTVLLGSGDGTFTPGNLLTTGDYPASLSAADFNGDGIPDLAIANTFDNTLTVLLGNGDGTFSIPTAQTQLPATGNNPIWTVVADLNADGKSDLAVVNQLDGTVTILLGAGDGTFTAQPAKPISESEPLSITMGDFNGDGVPDLAVANNAASSAVVSVLLTQLTQTTVAAASNVIVTGSGTHQIQAVYAGDGNFTSSISPAIPLYGPGASSTSTNISVTSSGVGVTSVSSGTVVTLTATVLSGGAVVSPGQVSFCDATAAHCTDNHLLGTVQLNSAGTGALAFVPGIGSHSYQAVFLGYNGGAGSASSLVPLTVTGLFPTLTTLTQSGSGNFTLTATVTGLLGPGAPSVTPTQSVSFVDTSNGNAVLATAPVSSTSANFNFATNQTPATGAEPYSIAKGDFNGDGKLDLATANFGDNTVSILLGNGDGTFSRTGGANLQTGANPTWIATADFNGDGKLDLATANSYNGTLTVLLGNGDGTFTSGPTLTAGRNPQSLALGDFNGDGRIDIAVANAADNSLSVFLGNGDGTFVVAATTAALGKGADSMVAADFNGDGKPDLATANVVDNTMTILLGNGDGSFTQGTLLNTGNFPVSIATADFNGDGIIDLVTANNIDNTATILLGNGDGTFSPSLKQTRVSTGNGPVWVAVGDLNQDGTSDLAISNATDNTVSILLGNGDGTFTYAYTTAPSGIPAEWISLGDFNGDGFPDLVTANSTGNYVTTLLTQLTRTSVAVSYNVTVAGAGTHEVDAVYSGDGNYLSSASPATALAGPQSSATSTSLIVTSGGAGIATVSSGTLVTLSATVLSGGVPVWPGQVNFCDATAAHCSDVHILGTGQLNSAGTAVFSFFPGLGSHSYQAVFTGFNGIGSSVSIPTPLSVTGLYPTTTTIAQSGTGNYTLTATVTGLLGPGAPSVAPTNSVSFVDTNNSNSILGTANLGTGTAGLSFPTTQSPSTGTQPYSIAKGDFNGDGKLDIATANYVDATVTVLIGNGDGSFIRTGQPNYKTGLDPTWIASGDFNGDGKLDLVTANSYGNSITVLFGNGDGTFALPLTLTPGRNPQSLVVGDFNGDGRTDIAVANAADNSITIFLSNGDGTFTKTGTSPSMGHYATSITASDFNGDGKLDLATANAADNTITVLLGNGDGTFTPAPGSLPLTGNYPLSIATGDFNGDGIPDLAAGNNSNNTLTILLGKGDGTFAAPPAQTQLPVTGNNPVSIAVVDINQDGNADLVVANSNSTTVTVLLGNGDGTFKPLAGTFGRATPISVTAGDFNGDGLPDLVTANSTDNFVNILTTQMTQTATAVVNGIIPNGLGTHQVQAAYSSDTNFGPSVSGMTGLVVVPTPAISVSVGALSFGSQSVGGTTASQPVVVTNAGPVALTFSSIKVTGAYPGSFILSNNCSASVPSGGVCTINVSFAPGFGGALSASLVLTDNALTSPQSVALSGTGTNPPVISLSTNSVAFGGQTVGVTTATQSITVTNTGPVAATFSSILLTGANVSSFVTSNTCGASLAAGATCKIGVRFVPTANGPLSAAIMLTDNAPSSPQSIQLSGSGGASPTISLSATSVAFGNQGIGTAATLQSIKLSNTGSAALNLTSIQLTGANTTSFTTSNTCGASVPAGGTCAINVGFSPTLSGPLAAAVTLADNASSSPQTIALSGTGINPPVITLSSTSAAFGTQTVGVTTATQSITLTNTGPVALLVSSIKLTGTNITSYVTSNTCSASVAVNATCKIGVRFVPTAPGPLPSTITLTDNALNSPQTIQLTGTGAGPAAVSLSAGGMAFSNQAVGSPSSAQSVTLTNTGSTTLTISAIQLAGSNATSFTTSNTCGTSVPAGGTCTINASFVPSLVGLLTASISLTDNAAASPQSIALSGTGFSVPVVTFSASSVSMGSQAIGIAGSPQNVTLTNTGAATLNLASIQLTGTNATSFMISNTCGGSIAAGGTCTISINFTPNSTGLLSASLVVTDDALTSPQTIALSGTGSTPPAVSLSSTNVLFGSQAVGTTTAVQDVTLTNTGQASLNLTSIQINGTYASQFGSSISCGATLPAGGTCTIGLSYKPNLDGAVNAIVTLVDNANDSPQNIVLSGTGFDLPVDALSTSSVLFGTQTVGTTSAAQNVTLTNSGDVPLAISSIQLNGANATSFVTANTCGTGVPAGGTCSLSLSFAPSTAGALSASLVVTDNAPDSPVSVAVGGTGFNASAASLSATSVAFGGQTVGVTTATQTITLTNNGTAALSVASIKLTGANTTSFVTSNTCGTSVAVGATCKIGVRFVPTMTGSLQGAIMLTDNAPNSPQLIQLTGTGTSLPGVSFSATSVAFGSQGVETSATPQSITLTNTGSGPLNITSIQLTGANPTSFTTSNTCGTSVAGGGTCTINLGFSPTLAGTTGASLTLIDNAPGSPQTIALSGTGINPPVASFTATSVAFGNQKVSVTTATQTITLTNTGPVALLISKVALTGANITSFVSSNTCGGGVAAAASCKIGVRFVPTIAGPLSAAITFTDNAASAPQTIQLTGTGQ